MSNRVTDVRRRRRPTRSGAVLSAELIVRTAMRLIDQPEGAGFSVRSLGIALGCDPTAIYRYFRSTEDLMRAIADELIGDSLTGFVPGPDWKASLRELGLRIHGHLQHHPGLAMVGAARMSLGPNEFREVDTGIGLLREAGFDPEDAVRYYHAFVDGIFGYAALDAAAAPLAGAPEVVEAWETAYAALPEEAYPHVAAARPHVHMLTGSAFPTALELLLEALDERAARLVR
jgi:AcrR family transcriptional regulator